MFVLVCLRVGVMLWCCVVVWLCVLSCYGVIVCVVVDVISVVVEGVVSLRYPRKLVYFTEQVRDDDDQAPSRQLGNKLMKNAAQFRFILRT